MSSITRRSFLQRGLAGTAAACAWARVGWGSSEPGAGGFDFGLPALGKVKPVRSKDVAASPLGVGFEVLDPPQKFL